MTAAAAGWLAAGAGALAGAGVFLIARAAAGPIPLAGWRPPSRAQILVRGWRPLAAIAGGAAAWVVTTWPVAGVLAGAAAWWLPGLLGPDREHARRVARIEAVAVWTEQLRDLLASAAGLHQAIAATATLAPEPIRAAVGRCAQQLRGGFPPQEAFTALAEELDVATADLVCAALAGAANRHVADLGALLSSLAEATREQAGLLVRVAASRARVRTATRIIVTTTIAMALGLLALAPAYLEPYHGPMGQLVLAVIGAVWALGLGWLARLARTDLGPRALRPAQSGEVAP